MRPLIRAKGFTLLEALIALLVLSIGMLGVAAMQLKALQGAHAAYQRSIASLAAQDAQERLWAEMADKGGLECPTWSSAQSFGGVSWHDTWEEYLPELVEEAVVPAASPNVGCEFTISVSWSEGRFSGESPPDFVYSVRLPGVVNEEE
ncbi:type IV pilus modification protein PilV [Halomonas mongoliensis]|uniref:type IV pilus modification protein PilV n=1 Tax=Halomonas mongoliensis TaxID=321265 RepID=UPI00403B1A0B